MDKYRVIFYQQAYSNILECVAFVNNVSPEAANALYEEIMSAADSLQNFPERYPEVGSLTIKDFKFRKMTISKGRYILLYRISSDEVIVYDIIDCRKENKLCSVL